MDICDRLLPEDSVAIEQELVVQHETPLEEVANLLQEHSVVLVAFEDGRVGAVERVDLEKHPMRMWLFGMISLVEMNTAWTIEHLFEGDSWAEELAPARLQAAEGLKAERERRGLEATLLSCLQFPDKAARADPGSRTSRTAGDSLTEKSRES